MCNPGRTPVLFAAATLATLGLTVLVGCVAAGAGGGSRYAHGDAVSEESSSVVTWVSTLAGDGYQPGLEALSLSDPAVLGPASSNMTDVVVLGRGGAIALDLVAPIADVVGAEIAVWENGISTGDLLFAELAYVEVSTDGMVFARFPIECRNAQPVSAFASLDPALYTGFAGLHPAGTGTAFDLAELSAVPEVESGTVDLQSVRYIRIVDVVGDGSESDLAGRPIYDPYPTAGTAGFDLNAVGVLVSP